MPTQQSERIHAAARHKGLTITELARILKVKPPTLHKGITRNQPTYVHLPRLAKLLEVDLEWLRHGEVHLAPAWFASAKPGLTDDLMDAVKQEMLRAHLTLLRTNLAQAQQAHERAPLEKRQETKLQLAAALAAIKKAMQRVVAGDLDGAMRVYTDPRRARPDDAFLTDEPEPYVSQDELIELTARLQVERDRLQEQVTALQGHLAAPPTIPAEPPREAAG